MGFRGRVVAYGLGAGGYRERPREDPGVCAIAIAAGTPLLPMAITLTEHRRSGVPKGTLHVPAAILCPRS